MMTLGAMAGWAETCRKMEIGVVIKVGERYYEWQSWEMIGVGHFVGYVAWDKSDHVGVHAYGDMASEMRECRMILELRRKYGDPDKSFKEDGWFIRNLTVICFVAAGLWWMAVSLFP